MEYLCNLLPFVCSSVNNTLIFQKLMRGERGPKRGRFPFWLPAGKSRKQGARMPAGNLMMERSFVSSPPAKGGDQFSLDSYCVGLPCYFFDPIFQAHCWHLREIVWNFD